MDLKKVSKVTLQDLANAAPSHYALSLWNQSDSVLGIGLYDKIVSSYVKSLKIVKRSKSRMELIEIEFYADAEIDSEYKNKLAKEFNCEVIFKIYKPSKKSK